jgi:Mor family transcriptional regulator
MNEKYKEIIADYKLGKDIACLASVYNLTCEEVENIIKEGE